LVSRVKTLPDRPPRHDGGNDQANRNQHTQVHAGDLSYFPAEATRFRSATKPPFPDWPAGRTRYHGLSGMFGQNDTRPTNASVRNFDK
jgi:hypothetical protein